jgi:hypothetical protein
MEFNSSACIRSVLNTLLLSVQRQIGVALAQFGDLLAGARQFLTGTVDAGIFFHRRHHFLAQPGHGFRAVALVEQGANAVFRVFGLGGQRRSLLFDRPD